MSLRVLSRILLGTMVLAVPLVAVVPARAAIDVDFGAAVRIGDNADLYFAVSSRYFGQDRQVVENWGRRCDDPDDLAVALFIARRSGRSPDLIFTMRRQGLSWWQIGVRTGVPVDAWFVPVRRDPGPPYGHAYGHWKKHRRDSKTRFTLSDDEARNLVAVRMIHEYYGVPVDAAMQWRSDGRKIQNLVADEYHRRHGKAPARGKSSAGKGSKHDDRGHGKHH
jgi:hypothetical protein